MTSVLSTIIDDVRTSWMNIVFLDQKSVTVHSRYFFGRTGRIRAVEVRPQKFRANLFRFGRISSIVLPKNLLIWGNFAQIERNSLEIFGAKLNCADSPISGEKNNYCVDEYRSDQMNIVCCSLSVFIVIIKIISPYMY
jgi:hypothetical protein